MNYVISDGSIIAEGTSRELLKNSSNFSILWTGLLIQLMKAKSFQKK